MARLRPFSSCSLSFPLYGGVRYTVGGDMLNLSRSKSRVEKMMRRTNLIAEQAVYTLDLILYLSALRFYLSGETDFLYMF